MTLYEFEQAKEILTKLEAINKNIEALDKAITDAYMHPGNKPRHKLVLDGSMSVQELDIDIKFIEMTLEYYAREGTRLEGEFASIGKEN
jgi:hypothetical protein